MKKMLLILFIGIAFVECGESLKLSEKNLQGNWYYCDESNEYWEFYVKNDSIVYMCGFIGSPMGLLYTIKKDSVTIVFETGDKNGVMQVELIDKNEMIHSWIGEDLVQHHYNAYRINENIETAYDYFDSCIKGDKKGNSKLEELFVGKFLSRSIRCKQD